MTTHGVDLEFGESLRRLFSAAGDPTLKACARAVSRRQGPVSAQRVSDWRSGRHRPKDFATVEPLLEWLTARALERGDTTSLLTADQWRAAWEAAGDPVSGDGMTQLSAPDQHTLARPFRGLRTLTEADAAIFFGRADVVDHVATIITATAAAQDGQIVVVTGPSGAGKSSLLGAGLATSAEITVVARGRPGPEPVAELIDGDGRADIAGRTAVGGSVSIVVIDQFEELFSGVAGDPAAYVQALDDEVRTRGLIAVIGVRADFFDRCVGIPILADAWQRNCVIVPAMNDRQLREVITGPARLAGCRVDTGLADLMIADVHRSADAHDSAGRLPLLAHVLQATWARRSNGRMTVSGYRATGGVSTAVAETAERAWASVAESDRASARDLLLSLTYLGPDGRRVRSSVSPAELADQFGARMDPVVDSFVAERLLVAGGDRIEYVHEIVLDAWPRLRRWIEEDRGAAIIRQEVDSAARAWVEADRGVDFLYNTARLELATAATNDGGRRVSDVGAVFLRASDHHERRRKRVRRTAVASVVVLAVAAVAAASIAVFQARTASDERADAQFLAMTSQLPTLRSSNPTVAAELALVAHRQRPTDRGVIGDIFATSGVALQSTLPGHIGAVYGVAYNRDSSLLASAGEDRTVQLWRMGPHTETRAATLEGFDNYVTSVSFDPVAPVLATGSGDGTTRLWDVSDPDRARQIGTSLRPGHGTVYNVVFAPNGRTLAAPSDDGSVTLYDVADPAHPVQQGPVLLGHTGAVRTLAFSPDSRLLASGGDDATTRLWNVSDPVRPRALATPIRGLGSINHSVAFDGTGTRLAVTGDKVNAQIWDVTDPDLPVQLAAELPGSTAKSWSISFGPRPGWLASAGLDGVIHTWNATDPAHVSLTEDLSAVSGREPGAFSLAYSPDGTALAGGYDDGAVRIWRFPVGDFGDRTGSVSAVEVDSARTLLATTGDDDTLHLMRVDPEMTRTPQLLSSTGIDHRVNDRSSLAIAGDGKQVATANNNGGRVQIWDTTDPTAPRPATDLAISTRYTYELAYSPTGHFLATGQTDNSVQIWDLTDPGHPVHARSELIGPTDLVTGLTFNRTGHLLAVTGNDRTVRIYDVTRSDQRPVATIATGTKTPARFSPVGDILVVGSPDGVTLWDVHDPAAPHRVSAVGDTAASSIAVSPDGRRIAVGTADARLVVDDISDPAHPTPFSDSVIRRAGGNPATEDARWQAVFSKSGNALIAAFNSTSTLRERTLNVDNAIEQICGRISTEPTDEEWEQSVRGVPYQSPCSA